MSKPSVGLYLDKRHPKPNETFNIQIRITFERKSKFYNTGIELNEIDFVRQRDCEILKSRKEIKQTEYNNLKNIQNKVNEKLLEATNKIANIKNFSFSQFEKTTPKTEKLEELDIYKMFEFKIQDLKNNDQFGSAILYECALSSIKKFTKSNTLHIDEIDKHFLISYQKWMVETNNNSLTTVGIYIRNLRAVYNLIINNDKTKVNEYPFGANKYKIPKVIIEKKALDNESLKKLFEYKPSPLSAEEKYLDFWKFSYMHNGMNIADIAKLKFEDIQHNELKFIRQKTANSTIENIEIKAYFGKEGELIIKKWGNKENHKSDFVFPIYDKFDNEEVRKKKRSNFVKQINKYVLKICQKINLDSHVTFYVARHSFFSKFYEETKSIVDVKNLAGHSSILTSENYIKSLKSKTKNDTLKNITNFG